MSLKAIEISLLIACKDETLTKQSSPSNRLPNLSIHHFLCSTPFPGTCQPEFGVDAGAQQPAND